MPKPSCSDEDFIRLWNDLQSPSQVAKALGIMPRSAQGRRTAIENRRGIKLPVHSDRAQNSWANTAAITDNRSVIKLQIADGVVLVGGDAHIWPGPRPTVQRAFIKFAEQVKPLAVVVNGDAFDGARVSRFDHGSWSDMEKKPTVKAELEAVGDFLGDVAKAAGSARRAWTLGNHDARFERRLVASNPDYAGVAGTRLKDHFPLWEPCWRVDINDDVVIRHRELGGEHADFRNAVNAGVTIVTNHDHRANVTHWRNYRGIHWGVRTGMLADEPNDPQFRDYLESKSPNWISGFAVLTFVGGRLLWPELCVKYDDNHVQFRGEVIPV